MDELAAAIDAALLELGDKSVELTEEADSSLNHTIHTLHSSILNYLDTHTDTPSPAVALLHEQLDDVVTAQEQLKVLSNIEKGFNPTGDAVLDTAAYLESEQLLNHTEMPTDLASRYRSMQTKAFNSIVSSISQPVLAHVSQDDDGELFTTLGTPNFEDLPQLFMHEVKNQWKNHLSEIANQIVLLITEGLEADDQKLVVDPMAEVAESIDAAYEWWSLVGPKQILDSAISAQGENLAEALVLEVDDIDRARAVSAVHPILREVVELQCRKFFLKPEEEMCRFITRARECGVPREPQRAMVVSAAAGAFEKSRDGFENLAATLIDVAVPDCGPDSPLLELSEALRDWLALYEWAHADATEIASGFMAKCMELRLYLKDAIWQTGSNIVEQHIKRGIKKGGLMGSLAAFGRAAMGQDVSEVLDTVPFTNEYHELLDLIPMDAPFTDELIDHAITSICLRIRQEVVSNPNFVTRSFLERLLPYNYNKDPPGAFVALSNALES